jgi:cyclopropane-fatty-acyl-phospholipid synthase
VSNRTYKTLVTQMLSEAGIAVGKSRPFDIEVKDERFYARFLADGTLGLGESYMDGWWECEALDEMMARFARAGLSRKFGRSPQVVLSMLRARLTNEGSPSNAEEGVRAHYDIGNDLYEAMLDDTMVYTCAFWTGAKDLGQAQEQKLELVCRKLLLAPGLTVLDIGCGWGGFAEYAAKHYGVSVVGVTNSREQAAAARLRCKGLPVEIRLGDYRDTKGVYDRVVSMGMFEHVCYKNHRSYMELVDRCLKDDGLSLLHTMGRKKSVVRGNDQWITTYIFPNTQVPSVQQIGEAIDDLFVMEDWENLSVNYEKTLLAWLENFDNNWPSLEPRYGERFRRMWRYYLLICAGWYRARALQLWQVVLSKNGIPGGYPYQQERTRLA